MSFSEGLIKLVIIMLFVPLPILGATLGGFWLDYHKLRTLPLFSALGAALGMLMSFMGVYQIIVYGHKEALNE